MASTDYNDLMNKAISYLIEKHSVTGYRIGMLMIASIFVDAWDLYAITLFGTTIEQVLHTTPVLFGLAAAATQGGAIVGTISGGWLTDKIGRRPSFILTMVILTLFAVLQAFSQNIWQLIFFRFILGYPIGMDIAVGYTYIMEYVKKGTREVMGNFWQAAFASGDLAGAAVAYYLVISHIPYSMAWRWILGLGGLWAIIILILRLGIPESVMWEIKQGHFKRAKELSLKTYNDPLTMLPEVDVKLPKPKLREWFAFARKDPIRWRGVVFGWLTNWSQSAEAAPFGLILAYFLAYFKITTVLGSIMWTMVFYAMGLVSSIVWPLLLPKIGHKKFQIITYGLMVIVLSIALYAVLTKTWIILLYLLPLWGFAQFGPAQSGMTISSMVAPPEFKGTASGFAYQFVKWPYFIFYIIVPPLMAMVGSWINPVLALIFAVIGLLGSIFILPDELSFGYKEVQA